MLSNQQLSSAMMMHQTMQPSTKSFKKEPEMMTLRANPVAYSKQLQSVDD
jgi:hypothetical protein